MNSQKKIAALYCRFSREDENDDGSGSSSIKNQKDYLTKYAKENNLSYEIYSDDGYSGTNFDRPDFKRMIRDIENGIIGTVVVKDLSRFGRNYAMVGYYLDEFFVQKMIRFISVGECIDTSVKEDEFVPFRNIMNDWYAKDISNKVKATLHTRGKLGKKMITVPIYGYKFDENHEWIIDEPAAQIVKRIFTDYLSGKGISRIAIDLSEENVPKPQMYRQGKNYKYPNWSRQTIRNILNRQEYVGDTINFKTLKPSYKSKKQIIRPKEENIVFLNTHEPIISREQFEDVQNLLAKNRRQSTNKIDKPNLFRGLLVCADCNHRMHVAHKKIVSGFSTSYICSTTRDNLKRCTPHTINQKDLVARVTDTLKKLIDMYQNDELVEYLNEVIFSDVKREESLTNEQLEKSNERLEEIDLVFKSLYEDKVKGIITDDMFSELFHRFKKEQEELRKIVYELTNKASANRDNNLKINRFLQIIKKYSDCSEAIDTLDREVILEFIDHIVIGERVAKEEKNQRQIDIYFKYVGLLGNLLP